MQLTGPSPCSYFDLYGFDPIAEKWLCQWAHDASDQPVHRTQSPGCRKTSCRCRPLASRGCCIQCGSSPGLEPLKVSRQHWNNVWKFSNDCQAQLQDEDCLWGEGELLQEIVDLLELLQEIVDLLKCLILNFIFNSSTKMLLTFKKTFFGFGVHLPK